MTRKSLSSGAKLARNGFACRSPALIERPLAVELLRDVYVWACERSARDYLRLRRELVAPDPQRLAWRDTIRTAVGRVVRENAEDEAAFVASLVEEIDASWREEVEALILEELRGLHEGVLARYALRPSEFAVWARRRRAM